MTKFLPLFPLKMIAFPGIEVKLHIFEPRYKQLILECIEEGKTFGIPPTLEKGPAEYGTEMKLVRVEKEYESGEMDITVMGISRFKCLEFVDDIPEKLYSGAVVADINDNLQVDLELRKQLFSLLKKVQKDLKIDTELLQEPDSIYSFEIADKIGLDFSQKLDLIAMEKESDRQKLLIEHLSLTVPIIKQANKLQFRSFLN